PPGTKRGVSGVPTGPPDPPIRCRPDDATMTMPLAAARSMSAYEWLLLFILSVLWGASFLFVAVAVAVLSPLSVVTVRIALADLFLDFAVIIMTVRMPFDRRSWREFLIMGFLNNIVPFSLIAWGQSHIASGLASILNATAPLYAVVVAHVFTP